MGAMNDDQALVDQALVDQLYTDLAKVWHKPSSVAAWAFLVTEVAEIGDVLLRQGHFGTFARNHEKPSNRAALIHELGDTYLMLCVLANSLDVNLSDALYNGLCDLRDKYASNQEEK